MKRLMTFGILIATFMLTGCGIYYPQMVDLPMLEQQGDLRANLSVNPGFLCTYTSAAYAATDHLGVQGSFNISPDTRAGQGALGWYNTWGHQVLEIYVGAGMGVSSYTGVFGGRRWGDFSTYFVQADYGWVNLANSHIDIGFGLKAGRLAGSQFISHDDDAPSVRKESVMLLEPTICLRVGWEHLKFTLTGGYAITSPTHILLGGGDPLPSASIGINYFLHTKR